MKSYFFIAAALVCALAGAQEPQARVIGEVTAAGPDALTIRADSGETVTVSLDAKTAYLRVPPGEKDLKNAVRVASADIGPGDRVLARGRGAASEKGFAASTVIVMTKSDLAQKQQRERDEWRRRGVAGTVTSFDPATKEIAISARREGARNVILETGGAEFLRYAPDSVRFQDVKPGSPADLKPGDQVMALGDRNQDGTRVKAERVVFGSFRNVAGTVLGIDAAAGELKITDLETNKPVTVRVDAASTLRRIPPMMAAMLARRLNAPAAGGPPHPAGAAADPQQMLERMPPLALAELKPGDAVIVSSTRGAEPGRITAITLVAGVEPLLTAAPEGARQVGGTWNFGDIVLPQ